MKISQGRRANSSAVADSPGVPKNLGGFSTLVFQLGFPLPSAVRRDVEKIPDRGQQIDTSGFYFVCHRRRGRIEVLYGTVLRSFEDAQSRPLFSLGVLKIQDCLKVGALA